MSRGDAGGPGFDPVGCLSLAGIGVGLCFLILGLASAARENPTWADVFVPLLVGLALTICGVLALRPKQARPERPRPERKKLRLAPIFGVALILIGLGLFVYGILGRERFGWSTEARLEAAVGAALAVGGLLTLRARK